MACSHRYLKFLICTIAAFSICGCVSDSPNISQSNNSSVQSASPVKSPAPSLNQQLFDVAGARSFKEEPGDDMATLSLIIAGANVNARDSASVPVLSVAVRSGRIEVLKVLLNHGADVNAQDDRGDTALMMAAGYSDPKMVQLLLDYKANVNITNKDGFTALSGSEMIGGSTDPDYLAVRRMLRKAGAK